MSELMNEMSERGFCYIIAILLEVLNLFTFPPLESNGHKTLLYN